MLIAVVIPCYKVAQRVLDVIAAIGPDVDAIYAIDDACPEGSGQIIAAQSFDDRVRVLYHTQNQGVGKAMVTGYKAALEDGMDIVIKIDGDGQMNPGLIPKFVRPIQQGRADYTKGNRFYSPESLRAMPWIRLVGNAGLSFITKLSTGYWPLMDPTNGYTAIHASVLRQLPLDRMEHGYFFESDMLYRLSIIRAVAHDVPMNAVYAGEESSLRIWQAIPEFLLKHLHRGLKRYIYMYLVRDFNLGSLYSIGGFLLCALGLGFGMTHWVSSAHTGQPASSGTVMLSALPVLIGIQFLIAFLHHDVSSVPTEPLSAQLD